MNPADVQKAAENLRENPLVQKALAAGFSFQDLVKLIVAVLQAIGPLLPSA